MTIAVVIPCYRVRAHVAGVIARVGPEVSAIYVVDDACPEATGDHVEATVADPRVTVLRHAVNQGVGGATLTGMARATADGATVMVKVDGDGQIDPTLIPALVQPILAGEADYAKGNRFHDPEGLTEMPRLRLFGNAGLSFLTKLSSGYWTIFDPTNGFVAIHAAVFAALPLAKIERRYFFESDMLFRLNVLRAMVVDVPMCAVYGDEVSGLHVGRAFPKFLAGNLRNWLKRIVYNQFLRDFSLATIFLVAGLALLLFGLAFGISAWIDSASSGVPASAGTVMLASLPIILGVQFLLSFIGYDIESTPRAALHPKLARSLVQHRIDLTSAQRS